MLFRSPALFLNIHMKITEYRLTARGWQAGKSYYWFPGDRAILPWARSQTEPCPGCGRLMTALQQTDHQCLGGTEAWPRIVNSRRRAAPALQVNQKY